MLSCFGAEDVEFLLVGAYAVGAHAVPRATGDMDLWVHATPENARRVISALKAFGAPLQDVAEADFATPGSTLQLGVAPRRINILTEIDGVSFDEAWRGRTSVEIDGLAIPVIGKAELLKNKKATGRRKDLADVALLEGED